MNDYTKFNVAFNINGVNFIDCRAFIKIGDCLYHRVGADEYNNCDILSSTYVEQFCNTENINYNDLITESQMNSDFTQNLTI